jgi:hypothetical protein
MEAEGEPERRPGYRTISSLDHGPHRSSRGAGPFLGGGVEALLANRIFEFAFFSTLPRSCDGVAT